MGKPAKDFFHMYAVFAANNDVSLVALSSLGQPSADIFDVKTKTRIYTTKIHDIATGDIPFIKKAAFSMDGNSLFQMQKREISCFHWKIRKAEMPLTLL